MAGALVVMAAFFQDASEQHKLTIYSLVIAVALVLQAAGVVAAAIAALRILQKIKDIGDSFEQKTAPVIAKSDKLLAKADALIAELSPKVAAITTNVEQISYTVREKVDELSVTVNELNKTVKEANLRTRVQVGRVDGIVTEALAATEEISQTVQQGIRGPVRQIVGVVAGVQAAIATLLERSPFGKRERPGPYDL